ncbi:DUF2333 family protein [Mesorhizobium sp. J428]|uniref:DUF2333 family protein n=1 Tax=Mesorhizobium sp. J428 TaxID=2898440 RepID=UPI002151BF74|nr:DUF2333 family protein [Mesorhizobium sp. J428]MCR5855641.1 DUF2333 family protein [Mesorhizobium sp. J428]
MLDPIVAFVTMVFQWIGRAIGLLIGVLMWPFLWFGRWYLQKGWILKAGLGGAILLLAALYVYFIYSTQRWTDFDPDYVAKYNFEQRRRSAGEQAAMPPQPSPAMATVEAPVTYPTATANTGPSVADAPAAAAVAPASGRSCGRSAIAEVAADLTDFNVNRNPWISSMILYKLGLFGLSWDKTPFLDNKASFQRGIHEAIRRTATELADNLGRVRGTSQIDANLQSARGNAQFDEYTWYVGLNPPGPKTPTPAYYREIVRDLRAFDDRLARCEAVFDARADNLIQYLDRIASALGDTSAILRERSENYNRGFFDTRADDRFWFAYGQLYAYYGLMTASHADFEDVIRERNLDNLWNAMEAQFRSALKIRPWIIVNSSEDGLFATHLATMGFYVLRVRSNLIEVQAVLQR